MRRRRGCRLDDDVEDHAALSAHKVELVAILHVAAAFDDDVGVGFEQAHQLLGCGHRLTGQGPAPGLREECPRTRSSSAKTR